MKWEALSSFFSFFHWTLYTLYVHTIAKHFILHSHTFIYWERERVHRHIAVGACVYVGGAGRERIASRLHAGCGAPHRAPSHHLRSWSELKSSLIFNQLSHPGAPSHTLIFNSTIKSMNSGHKMLNMNPSFTIFVILGNLNFSVSSSVNWARGMIMASILQGCYEDQIRLIFVKVLQDLAICNYIFINKQ